MTKTPEEDPKRVPALRAQTETSDLITPLDVEAPSEVVEDAPAYAETTDLLSPPSDSAAGETDDPYGSAGDDPLLPDGSTLALENGAELEIERVLGRGGMGVVYLVHDPRLQRKAALKLVRDSSNARRAERFRREAEITAHLDHPGIPPVFERGRTTNGQDYLLLRYVEGKSLAEKLETLPEKRQAARRRGEAYSVPRALLEALARVADAVAYAHSRGIVHRDLKPDNVMLGPFGEVLVMDWGLARDLREDADSAFLAKSGSGAVEGSADGPLLGTLGYMAPEQARREDVDPQADVYGLGAILTEALTGAPPVAYQGATALDVLQRTREGQIQTPGQRDPHVSPELNAIACAATAPARRDRYPSVEAFAKDLQAFLAGRRVSVYDYRAVERLARGVKRHSTWVVVVACLLLGLLGAYQARRAERHAQLDEARLQAARAWAELREAPADRDAWLSRAWAALTAAQRWHQQDPDSRDAAEASFRAAFLLGDNALDERQWSLARQAYMQALGLGVDDARAERAIAQVDAARAQAEEASRVAVEELLGRALRIEAGDGERALELAHELAREARGLPAIDPLTERLDEVTRQLKRAQHRVLLAAAEPDAAEREQGEGVLSGLEIALVAWESDGLAGAPLRRGELEAARERLEGRADRRGDPQTWLQVVAQAQRQALDPAEHRLAGVLCEAMGHLGRREAVPPLARYVWFEADPKRAAIAGRSLSRLGADDLARAAIGRRFTRQGAYAHALDR